MSELHALRSEDASSLAGGPPHALPPCDVLTALDAVSCSQITAASAGLYFDALVTVAKTPPPRWWAGNVEGVSIQRLFTQKAEAWFCGTGQDGARRGGDVCGEDWQWLGSGGERGKKERQAGRETDSSAKHCPSDRSIPQWPGSIERHIMQQSVRITGGLRFLEVGYPGTATTGAATHQGLPGPLAETPGWQYPSGGLS